MKKFLIKNRNKHIYGVSLIEILVAMSILTVGLFMIYNIFPLGFAAAYRSKNRTIATQLAQQKLEEILTNSRPVACQQQSSRPCVIRPLETDPANPIDYDATFDCRHYYGGAFVNNRVQDATYCGIHSGPIDSAASWSRFPSTAGDESFWYHIEVMPVTDPAQKFRSLANMSRITVTIRGPIADMNTWEELAQTTSTGGLARKRNMMPTEVFISTLVTNKSLPFTEIDNNYNTGNYRNGLYDADYGNHTASTILDSYTPEDSRNFNGRRIRVNNIRNFSMFHHVGLSQAERDDTGQIRYYKVRPQGGGYSNFVTTDKPGNFYGLDNVMVVRRLRMYRNDILTREETVTQTAKVMRIIPAGNPNPETTREIPGDLVLFDPLYVDRHQQIFFENEWRLVAHTDASIIDKERYFGFNTIDFHTTSYAIGDVATRPTGYALRKPVYQANWVGRSLETPTGYDIPYHGSSRAGTFAIKSGGAEDPSGTPQPGDTGYGFKPPANPLTDLGDIDFACRRMPGRDASHPDWEINSPPYWPGWSGYASFIATPNQATVNGNRFPADGMPIYEHVEPSTGGVAIPEANIVQTVPDFDYRYEYDYYVIHLTNVKVPQQ